MPLRVQDLTFFRHPMAADLDSFSEEMIGSMPHLNELHSAKQAVVQFGNGWSMSFLTLTPLAPVGVNTIKLFHGDARIPTYEIAVFDPEGTLLGPYYDFGVDEANNLIAETMSRDYLGLDK